MKRLLRCEEWAKISVGPGKELESLEEVSSILMAWKQQTGNDPAPYFDVSPGTLRPKFWSGTLSVSQIQLEVVPIGATLLDGSGRSLLDASLSKMLESAASSHYLNAGAATLRLGGERYESLIQIFCEELKVARRRQVLRKYISVQDSLPTPRGRISFPSQCFESISRPGRFATEWVALTEDIPENRIFKEVLLRYRPRCSSYVRGKIDACLAELDSVCSTGDVRLEWSRVRKDRIPAYYQALFELSKSLLNEEGVGLFTGETLATSQILFTSRLFERYVSKVLSRVAPLSGLNAISQEHGNFLSIKEGTPVFEVVPDVRLVDKLGQTRVIFDAKWKHLNHAQKGLGIKIEDIYQVLIYASKFDCENIALLYPDISAETGAIGFSDEFKVDLAGIEYTVHVLKLPMLNSKLAAAKDFLCEFVQSCSAKAPKSFEEPQEV